MEFIVDKLWPNSYTHPIYDTERDFDVNTMSVVWESLLDQHEPFKQKGKTKRPELKVMDF